MGLEPISGGNGLDTENFEPGEAVIYLGDGEFTSAQVSFDLDTEIYEQGEKSGKIDVSGVTGSERFKLTSEDGEYTTDGYRGSGDGPGSGWTVEFEYDLTEVDRLEVVVADERTGFNDGEPGEPNDDGDNYGGYGGGSTALLADGELVVEVSGGGGDGHPGTVDGFNNIESSGGDGGDGGGPDGGTGGNGLAGAMRPDDGGDGGYSTYGEGVEVLNDSRSERPARAILFD